MTTIEIPFGDDWRATFKLCEMAFFNVSAEEWPDACRRRMEHLTNVYDELRHRAHVGLLNDHLGLFPRLDGHEFDGATSLAELRESLVEPRVPVRQVGTRHIELSVPDDFLDALDMTHLRKLRR